MMQNTPNPDMFTVLPGLCQGSEFSGPQGRRRNPENVAVINFQPDAMLPEEYRPQ